MSTNAPAPGELELVRRFLNTWTEGVGGRASADLLPDLVADPAAWVAALPGLPHPGPGAVPDLLAVRAGLREALGRAHPVGLADLVDRHALRAVLADEPSARPVSWQPVVPDAAGVLVGWCVTAVAERTWHRLKACPDCRFVFYDVTRNASRTWCAMSPSTPGGRGCGGIAKARAHRARAAAEVRGDTA